MSSPLLPPTLSPRSLHISLSCGCLRLLSSADVRLALEEAPVAAVGGGGIGGAVGAIIPAAAAPADGAAKDGEVRAFLAGDREALGAPAAAAAADGTPPPKLAGRLTPRPREAAHSGMGTGEVTGRRKGGGGDSSRADCVESSSRVGSGGDGGAVAAMRRESRLL